MADTIEQPSSEQLDGAVPGMQTSSEGLGSPAQAAALATLCLVLFLTFLDNTIVSVGLADIQGRLQAGVTSLQWVVNGYALTFASFMLAAGTLGDLWGRKKIMLGGVAVFCIGSVVAATAVNVNVLIAARVIMGVGAAASEPGTLSMIRHVYPNRKTRASALGVWAAVSGLALALGPLIGGVLVGLWDWRAIFWFNLVFGVMAFTMAAIFVPETFDRSSRRLDVLGIGLGVIALATASFAVIQGELSGYSSWWIMLLFGVAVVSAIAFVLWERHAANPVLDLAFFKQAAFAGSNFVAFATYFGTFAVFFFTALYLEVVANNSPYQIAIDFIPMAAVMILASVFTGPWVARWHARIPMTVGCIVAGAGLLVIDSVLTPTAGVGTLGWALAIAGIGFGIALVPATSTPLTVVPPERSGMAASATNTSRELGAVFGVAILGSIVNAKLTGGLAARLKAIGIPPKFQDLVITAVTHGGVPGAGSGATKSSNAAVQKTIDEVINAAYSAFGSGLHVALGVSGGLLLIGGAVAALTIHRSPTSLYEP